METAYINAVGFNGEKLKIELSDKLKEYFKLECNKGEFYIVKKESQYPKTYQECCKIVGERSYENTLMYKHDLMLALQRLLICRDAYWKIAGEQMGLDKTWYPDYIEKSYEQGCPVKYVIYYTGTNITKERKCTPSYLLSFPTKEMRDAFYENFKELIEQCKELL